MNRLEKLSNRNSWGNMKIFSQDLKEYNISCVNAISILNAGLTKFDNDELVIKTKRIISK